jgi:hypothetical protein
VNEIPCCGFGIVHVSWITRFVAGGGIESTGEVTVLQLVAVACTS